MRVFLKGEIDVHRENADNEGGQHNTNSNNGKGLDTDVEVIADD